MSKETGFQVIENEETCVKGVGEIILRDIATSGIEEEFNEVISFCDERVKEPIFALCGNHDLPD